MQRNSKFRTWTFAAALRAAAIYPALALALTGALLAQPVVRGAAGRRVPVTIVRENRPEVSSAVQRKYFTLKQNLLFDLLKIAQPQQPASSSKERFFLAFVAAGSAIKTLWSPDGTAWNAGNFPAAATSPTPPANAVLAFQGVGASADPEGIIHNVVFDQPFAYEDVWGLGPTIWDNTGLTRPLDGNPLSAPSAIDFGGGRRAIAVRGAGGNVAVHYYDHDQREVIAKLPIAGALNGGVTGRPDIVLRDDGKVLIAWPRNGSTIVAAIGEEDSYGLIDFAQPSLVTLAARADLAPAAVSPPALAHDDTFFYIGVVQEERGQPLHGWHVVIYRSQDGTNWTVFSETLFHEVNNQSQIQMAAKSNGTLLVAALRKTDISVTSVARLCTRTSPTAPCGSWTGVPSATMFGASAEFRGFALIRTGSD